MLNNKDKSYKPTISTFTARPCFQNKIAYHSDTKILKKTQKHITCLILSCFYQNESLTEIAM